MNRVLVSLGLFHSQRNKGSTMGKHILLSRLFWNKWIGAERYMNLDTDLRSTTNI